jgi:hypothetical protein
VLAHGDVELAGLADATDLDGVLVGRPIRRRGIGRIRDAGEEVVAKLGERDQPRLGLVELLFCSRE